MAACALTIDPLRAQAFTRSLYRLFWVEGKGISDEGLLQREAERHGFAPQISGTIAIPIDQTLREWEESWTETEHQGEPLLARPDHAVLVGLMPVNAIQRFFAEE